MRYAFKLNEIKVVVNESPKGKRGTTLRRYRVTILGRSRFASINVRQMREIKIGNALLYDLENVQINANDARNSQG